MFRRAVLRLGGHGHGHGHGHEIPPYVPNPKYDQQRKIAEILQRQDPSTGFNGGYNNQNNAGAAFLAAFAACLVGYKWMSDWTLPQKKTAPKYVGEAAKKHAAAGGHHHEDHGHGHGGSHH